MSRKEEFVRGLQAFLEKHNADLDLVDISIRGYERVDRITVILSGLDDNGGHIDYESFDLFEAMFHMDKTKGVVNE